METLSKTYVSISLHEHSCERCGAGPTTPQWHQGPGNEEQSLWRYDQLPWKKGEKMSKIGEGLGRTADAVAQTQFSKARLMLVALPCMALFVAAGAQLMVALMADIAVAVPVFFAWEERLARRRGLPGLITDAKEARGMLIGMAFLLTLAADTQTVIWSQGLAARVPTKSACMERGF